MSSDRAPPVLNRYFLNLEIGNRVGVICGNFPPGFVRFGRKIGGDGSATINGFCFSENYF